MSHCRIRVSWTLAVVALSGLSANSARAQHHEGQHHGEPKVAAKESALPKCPVMGDPVDFSVKTMTPDGPVYFCCKDCIKKFESDRTKYAKAVAEQRKVLAALPKVQVSCPVSGKPIDAKAFVEVGGKKVFFCCKNCIEKYQSEPDKYQSRLLASYTYQTKCPVSGDNIDPGSFITLKTGQTVYFCCGKCHKNFLKDPAKYVGNLEDQGTRVNPKKVELAENDGDKNGGEKDHKEHGGPGHDHDH